MTAEQKNDAGAGWPEEQLRRAVERIDELARELARAQEAVASQQAESARLQQALAVVEGRTQRHESAQDAVRSMQQDAAAIGERLEAEASLRRDLAAAVQHQVERERDETRDLRTQLEFNSARLVQLEQRLVSDGERKQQINVELADRRRQELTVDERLARLEQAGAADREALRAAAEELARFAAAVPPLRAAVDEQETRYQALQRDSRRLTEQIASLRSERDRESELLEVVEQQRAARQRMEERLSAVDEVLEEVRQQLAQAVQERLMLRQQLAGTQQRLRDLAEAAERQREAVTEVFKQLNEVRAEAARRQAAEVERAARAERDLLVRFSERVEESDREQPL